MLTLWQTRSLLTMGVYQAARKCLAEYGGYGLYTSEENPIRGPDRSRVDDVLTADGTSRVLCEAKSPSVMKQVGELLPQGAIKLEWTHSQSLMQKILAKVSMLFFVNYDASFNKYMQSALYLGLKQMEWLFLSCHNYWIVCRLVKDDNHPFLAYSPLTSIENTSEPYRAFLGAILSDIKGIAVAPSPFNPDMELDSVVEEDKDKVPGIPPQDDIDHGSGGFPDSSSTGTARDLSLTSCCGCKHICDEDTESGLMVCLCLY
jgi:hypothetical protein